MVTSVFVQLSRALCWCGALGKCVNLSMYQWLRHCDPPVCVNTRRAASV